MINCIFEYQGSIDLQFDPEEFEGLSQDEIYAEVEAVASINAPGYVDESDISRATQRIVDMLAVKQAGLDGAR